MLAAIRPDSWNFPLLLHVLGAMLLFGGTLTAAALAVVSWRRPQPVLARATFWALLVVAIPSWVLMRAGAAWIYSKEGFTGDDEPSWLGLGFAIADAGLILLLLSTGAAFWWQRGGRVLAGRLVAGLTSIYVVLLAVAWFAMSGKWG